MRTLVCVLMLCLAGPVMAQSSLGVTGAAFSLGAVEDEDGTYRGDARASVDVAITDYHGFQGDLAYTDSASGGIGTVATHLYMTPQPGQKYGLFAALSDVDGRSLIYGSVGAEGMFSLGAQTSIEGRAGMGWADSDGLDYIFGSASIAHAVTPSLELELALDVTEIDEAALSAVSIDAGLTARFNPDGAPLGGYVSVTQCGLTGRDAGTTATRLGIPLLLTLGTSGGTDPHTRPFRTMDPIAPLVRRGLW